MSDELAILGETGLQTQPDIVVLGFYLNCKALGLLDIFLVVNPPLQRTGFVVYPVAPAPVFYSHAVARSTVDCRCA